MIGAPRRRDDGFTWIGPWHYNRFYRWWWRRWRRGNEEGVMWR